MAHCKLLLSSLVVLSCPIALLSIWFDDYDDPDEIPQDGFDTNEFPCLKIKSKCRGSWECCRKAICVLPAWSDSPVCLVPGYKEDDRLARISARDPPRLEDILYIRNMYNTTFYDFLLSDFTSPAPHLETLGANSSESDGDGASAQNVTIVGDGNFTAYDVWSNSSDESYPQSYEAGSNQMINASIVKDFDGSKLMKEPSPRNSLKLPHVNTSPLELKSGSYLTPDIRSPVTTIPLNQLTLKLSTRQSFILLNRTVRVDSNTNMSKIYNNLQNTDQFKIVVKKLQDKLRRLNEQERLGMILNEAHVSSTTETPMTSEKSSKWDVVRKFFLNKQSPSNYLKNTNIEKDVSTRSEASINPISSFLNENGKYKARDLQKGSESEEIDSDEKIREILDHFMDNNKVDEIVKNTQNIDQEIDSQKANGGDILEFYNIDIPNHLDDSNQENSLKLKTSLEKTFSALANTIGSLKPKYEKNGKRFGAIVTENKTYNNEYVTLKPFNNNSMTTTEKPKNSTMKVHLWQKAFLWPVRQNVSTKLAKDFKSVFVWKRKPTKLGNHNVKRVTLNEKFLLSLNSKNNSALVPEQSMQNKDYPEQISTSEKASPDYSFHYSTSEESTEDRYNNSFVFVMNKDPSDSEKRTKLNRILNFFHITKVNPQINKTNPYVDSSKESSTNNVLDTTTVREIIRLPENLMPEALQGRQLNDTDILFLEDSKEEEDKTIEEHSSTNSTFLFFFKYK